MCVVAGNNVVDGGRQPDGWCLVLVAVMQVKVTLLAAVMAFLKWQRMQRGDAESWSAR
jgi:hypothetical protein